MGQHEELRTVWWENEQVHLIDQRRLPQEQIVVQCSTLSDVANAIKSMQVRGAPAIGIAAAYGLALHARQLGPTSPTELYNQLQAAKTLLDAQRPTAVNLSWATTRLLRVAARLLRDTPTTAASDPAPQLALLQQKLLDEAHALRAEDLAMCHAIGAHGASLIPTRGHVLTHCNAGGLATAGYGTALAPLRTLHSQGRTLHVYVDETRPFLQGARLTSWELQQAGVPQTLIPDSMAGYLMRTGEIDCVIVGADRIVANGDVANKIGTYTLAVLAHAHQLPFYVAAPTSTIDLSCAQGADIPIEERAAVEVTHIAGRALASVDIPAAHPAFDVTPHTLITAIITERGAIFPPFATALRAQVRPSGR